MENRRSIFKDSVNRERLTKSIKLELVPHPSTMEAMERDGVAENDRKMKEKADAIKPAIDIAVKQIIEEALGKAPFSFTKLFDLYDRLKDGEPEPYKKAKEDMVKKISGYLSSYKPNKDFNGINNLGFFRDYLPAVVSQADICQEEKEKYFEILKNPNGFLTLMTKFLTSRMTALATWAPERVLENFEIYADNRRALDVFMQSPYAEPFLNDFPEFSDITTKEYYDYCLSPSAISGYNRAIQGIFNEQGECTVKGYNAYISEINRENRTNKAYQGPFFRKIRQLYQQVLFPRKPLFTVDHVRNDDEARVLIKETLNQAPKEAFYNVLSMVKKEDPSHIVVSGNTVHTLSHLAVKDHNKFRAAMEEYEKENIKKKIADREITKSAGNKLMQNIEKVVSKNFYTIAELEDITGNARIFDSYVEKLSLSYAGIASVLNDLADTDILSDGKLLGYEKNKRMLKRMADAYTDFSHTVKLIMPKNTEKGEPVFYNSLEEATEYFQITKKFANHIHHYMTQKTGDLADEYVVGFGSATRSAGMKWWNEDLSVGQEQKLDNSTATIIEMDKKYYYCFSKPGSSVRLKYADGDDCYRALNQKTSQKARNCFPKVIFSDNAAPFFKDHPEENVFLLSSCCKNPVRVTREAYRIYTEGLAKVENRKSGIVSEVQFKHNLKVLIDLYREFAENYIHFSRYAFGFRKTEEYADLGEFYNEADTYMVSSRWIDVSRKFVDEMIRDGELYAFLIKNKNMYEDGLVKTSYAEIFLELMSDRNMESGRMRLNSKPQITFRPAVLPFSVTHPAGSVLVNHLDKNGNRIHGVVYKELYNHLNGNLEKENMGKKAVSLLDNGLVGYFVTDHDVIRDRRYKMDKYFISLSYVVNAKVSERSFNTINDDVKEHIRNGCKKLVVSRGIHDLIYYTVFDENGEKIEARSLNVISGTDYGQRLREMSQERKEEQSKEWNNELTVRGSKEWYLNAAIGEIIKAAVKHEAVIVIEKINDSFKDKMSCIDNQVFKVFENKIENRLRDYHEKHNTSLEAGSIANPLQLAGNSMGVQNGILFRFSTGFLSLMDHTGFVNLFQTKNIHTVEQKKDFLDRFYSIEIEDEMLKFSFSYKNFETRYNVPDVEWNIFVGKPITVYDREKKVYKMIHNPAGEIIDKLHSQGITGMIDTDAVDNSTVSELYEVLMQTLKYRVVKKCDGNEEEYFNCVSDKTDRGSNFCLLKCENLKKKMDFYLYDRFGQNEDTVKKNESTEKYTERFLNWLWEQNTTNPPARTSFEDKKTA